MFGAALPQRQSMTSRQRTQAAEFGPKGKWELQPTKKLTRGVLTEQTFSGVGGARYLTKEHI
jgi:hypothetical protein